MAGAVAARLTDYRGRAVELSAAAWRHIVLDHPELTDPLQQVTAAITDPDWVRADKRQQSPGALLLDAPWRAHGQGGYCVLAHAGGAHRPRQHGVPDQTLREEGALAMAMTKRQPDNARTAAEMFVWPVLGPDDLDRAEIHYDGPSDELNIHLLGTAQPAYQEPLDEREIDYAYVSLRLGQGWEATDQVVGVMVLPFLGHAVGVHPEWQDLLVFTGPEPFPSTGPFSMALRRERMAGLLADIAAMPVYDATSGTPEGAGQAAAPGATPT